MECWSSALLHYSNTPALHKKTRQRRAGLRAHRGRGNACRKSVSPRRRGFGVLGLRTEGMTSRSACLLARGPRTSCLPDPECVASHLPEFGVWSRGSTRQGVGRAANLDGSHSALSTGRLASELLGLLDEIATAALVFLAETT